MKKGETIPRIFDPALDGYRPATQADVDLLWEISQVYGRVASMLKEGEYFRARAEVVAISKSKRAA